MVIRNVIQLFSGCFVVLSYGNPFYGINLRQNYNQSTTWMLFQVK